LESEKYVLSQKLELVESSKDSLSQEHTDLKAQVDNLRQHIKQQQ